MGWKVRLRIHCDRRSRLAGLLLLALLVALLLPALVWARQSAVSSPRATSSRVEAGALPLLAPRYYLTNGMYNGADADGTDGNGAGVCAAGYHFASLWEILDPSNLRYNTELGLTRVDSGQGPPTFSTFGGWVRTGYNSASSGTPGVANCAAWISADPADSGTYARLPSDWDTEPNMGAWEIDTAPCSEALLRVWCVADRAGFAIYLPLVMHSQP
jgi:hypothetical protein